MFRFLCSNTVEYYGLNRMSLFKSYWTVPGISPDARNAAVRAAEADGEEVGVWLSRLIYKISTAERNASAGAKDIVDTADKVDAANDEDDKLSSIERAMQQSRAAGDAGSA